MLYDDHARTRNYPVIMSSYLPLRGFWRPLLVHDRALVLPLLWIYKCKDLNYDWEKILFFFISGVKNMHCTTLCERSEIVNNIWTTYTCIFSPGFALVEYNFSQADNPMHYLFIIITDRLILGFCSSKDVDMLFR